MIRVALTDAAYDAIASTLPKGAAWWPMQRDRGQCFIQVEAAVVDRMRAMRRPSESYAFRTPTQLSYSLKNQMIGHLTALPWPEASHDPFNDVREHQCRDRWSERPNGLTEPGDI
jgi:hypothetical protein